MRVGAFVLAAQFPGQGQREPLHRAVRTAEAGGGVGARRGLARRAPFRAVRRLPLGGDAGRAAAGTHPAHRRRHRRQRAAQRPPRRARRAGRAAAPRLRRALHARRRPRRPVGRPRGLRRRSGRVRARLPRGAGPAAALAARAPRRLGRRAVPLPRGRRRAALRRAGRSPPTAVRRTALGRSGGRRRLHLTGHGPARGPARSAHAARHALRRRGEGRRRRDVAPRGAGGGARCRTRSSRPPRCTSPRAWHRWPTTPRRRRSP